MDPQILRACEHRSKHVKIAEEVNKDQADRTSKIPCLQSDLSSQQLRGGAQDEFQTRIRQYYFRVLNDKVLDSLLQLFIQTRAKNVIEEKNDYNPYDEKELYFDVMQNLLNDQSTAKVMLLGGEPGAGKTLFCKYLQRTLIEMEDQKWWPIFIELTNRKSSLRTAISETFAQELGFTDDEIERFQEKVRTENISLLFIFDDYDPNEQSGLISLKNFYELNRIGAEWGKAKAIVTADTEKIVNISQRGQLFAPLRKETKQPIPGSYIEREIVRFSDEDVKSYIKKKFGLMKYPERFDIPKNSWELVKVYSEIIDRYHLRELTRVPLVLFIAIKTLPEIDSELPVPKNDQYEDFEINREHDLKFDPFKHECDFNLGEEFDREGQEGEKQAPKLSQLTLLDYFVNKSFKALINANFPSQSLEEQDRLLKDLHLRVQEYALSLSNYSIEPKSISNEKIEELLSQCPFIQVRHTQGTHNFSLKFASKTFQSYFVAKTIEAEIRSSNTRQNDGIEECKLFSQKLLTDEPLILKFLVDAIRDYKITAESLLAIIKASRKESNAPEHQMELEKEKNVECHQKLLNQSSFPNTQSHAPANAMTVLNAANHNFSSMDLSHLCLAGANLSRGIFNMTDFTCSDLSQVNFARAYLHNANLMNANLAGINFGVFPNLELDHNPHKLRFSVDGMRIGALVRSEIVVFQKDETTLAFSESTKLLGHSDKVLDFVWSIDGKKIISAGKDKIVYIWDVDAKKPIKKYESILPPKECNDGTLAYKFESMFPVINACSISPDFKKMIISERYNNLRMWGAETGICNTELAKFLSSVEDLGFSPNGKTALAIGRSGGIQFWNDKGKYIQRYCPCMGNNPEKCSYTSESTQLAILMEDVKIVIRDAVRGNQIKLLRNTTDYRSYNAYLSLCSFSPDGTKLITMEEHSKEKKVFVKDVSTGECIRRLEFTAPTRSYDFSNLTKNFVFSPDGQFVIASGFDSIIRFWDINSSYNKNKGANSTKKPDFYLVGANFGNAKGLSDANIAHFRQKGSYGRFSNEGMKEIIFNSDITEIDLGGEEVSEKNSWGTQIKSRDRRKRYLAETYLGDEGGAIIGRYHWHQLRKLDLSANKIGFVSGKIIGENTTWKELIELRLDNNEITFDAVIAIAKNPTWKKLQVLSLRKNKILDAGVAAIGKSLIWEKLEQLYLDGNEIGDSGATGIGGNTSWKDLRILSLANNKITDKGLEALTSNPTWRKLENLSLRGNQIEDPKDCLENCTAFSSLRSLNLTENSIGDEGAAAIGKNTSWVNLEELCLSFNQIGDKGAAALASNTSWIGLRKLYLTSNDIGDEGAVSIGNNIVWTSLEGLYLNQNHIKDKGALAIGSNPAWKNLLILDLSVNLIGDDGAIGLAGAEKVSGGLEETKDEGNQIEEDKMKKTICKSVWANLQTLNLRGNKIGDLGACAIAENMVWINLVALNLSQNEIRNEGALAISQNTKWKKLKRLSLHQNPGIPKVAKTALQSNPAFGKNVRV